MGHQPGRYLCNQAVDKFGGGVFVSESNSNSAGLQGLLKDTGALSQEE